MRVILDQQIYDKIWDFIKQDFHFNPSTDQHTAAFAFPMRAACFGLKRLWDDRQEETVNGIMMSLFPKRSYMRWIGITTVLHFAQTSKYRPIFIITIAKERSRYIFPHIIRMEIITSLPTKVFQRVCLAIRGRRNSMSSAGG